MVIFRVTENINIKTTDGTLVRYTRLKNPANFYNEGIFISSFEDFEDLKTVFKNVGRKYRTKTIDELRVRNLQKFPKELGISNINEFSQINSLDFKYKKYPLMITNEDISSLYLDENRCNLDSQLEGVLKQDISIAILGNLGLSISEMICSCTALRILYEKLKKRFKNVKIDIFLNASDNKYFTRDKSIYSNQTFINDVLALSVDVKTLCEYDFFIDGSSVTKRSYYETLPHIDAWLYKFGIDYSKIPLEKKYNTVNLTNYRPKEELKQKLKNLKKEGKILLFHPFSANIDKSIPKELAVNFIKEFVEKMPDYSVVSAVKLDLKNEIDGFTDLSSFSQNFLDYAYIVSNASKIVTVNSATYHLAEAFFIPTVTIFTDSKKRETPHLYSNAKGIYVKDKSKEYSRFIFQNDYLTLYKFKGWKDLKAKKIIKLLESF